MKKLLVFAFVFAVSFFFSGQNVNAEEMTPARDANWQAHQQWSQANGGDIRHTEQPHTMPENGWMKAHVRNVTETPDNKLVCVEAFNNANNTKTHLGCLTINWQDINWQTDFNAPTNWLGNGSYRVVYTYQGQNGNWNTIKSINMTAMNGTYANNGNNTWASNNPTNA